jgi:hypothetical protein
LFLRTCYGPFIADHDHGYKLLFSHASVVADVLRGYVKEDWIEELDLDSLEDLRRQVGRMAVDEQMDEGFRRSVHTWLTRVMIPARFPGLQVPEASSLKEVHAMLAERVMEWTREWKEEGRQEGWQEGLHLLLLDQIEERFGRVPQEIRRRVEEIHDTEQLRALGKRLLSASSLADLRLN